MAEHIKREIESMRSVIDHFVNKIRPQCKQQRENRHNNKAF